MAIIIFLILHKLYKIYFFEKIFLLPDTMIKVILNISFKVLIKGKFGLRFKKKKI